MPVAVRNLSRQPVTINLLRGVEYGEAWRPDVVERASVVRLPDGSSGVRVAEVTVVRAVSWRPGETLSGLPDKLVDIPQYKALASRGVLRMVEVP